MTDVSDKGRWGGAGPTAVPVPRRTSTRDLIAIVAGSLAVAGLGVAFWPTGGNEDGVSLRPAASSKANGDADIAATDGGWSSMSLPGFGDAKPVPTGPLIARTDAEHVAHTQAFAHAMMPRLRAGEVDGFTIRDGALPAVFIRAGVQAGDVVTAVNGTALTSNKMVSDLSRTLADARTATFAIERGGKVRSLSTRLQGLT